MRRKINHKIVLDRPPLLIPSDVPRKWAVVLDCHGRVRGEVRYMYADSEATTPFSRSGCYVHLGVDSGRLFAVTFPLETIDQPCWLNECRSRIDSIKSFLSQVLRRSSDSRLSHQIALDSFPVERVEELFSQPFYTSL
jgi:hypothetical protein